MASSSGAIMGGANDGRRRRGREVKTQTPSDVQRTMRRAAGRYKRAARSTSRVDRQRSY